MGFLDGLKELFGIKKRGAGGAHTHTDTTYHDDDFLDDTEVPDSSELFQSDGDGDLVDAGAG